MGTSQLLKRVEFQTGKTSDILVRKDAFSEFILRGVFQIARNDFYFTPDGNYDPDNTFSSRFQDVKLNCRLACSTSSLFPFAITDFSKYIDNLRSCEKLIKSYKGDEVNSSIYFHLGKSQLKLTHPLFEAITLADDETPSLGSEFAMETWPVAPRSLPSLKDLFNTHDICPIPAYDTNDNLIPPTWYESMLKGATAEVHFAFTHHYIKKKNKHFFTGVLRRLQVLEKPAALPSSPFKRVRVSASPGKGKGRA
ncbi:hypothetical protein EV363DRAFT_1409501 [Boletus edulis]|nr:hypothetical protein EV363DRAFT_1409501 [Boletus edulis]